MTREEMLHDALRATSTHGLCLLKMAKAGARITDDPVYSSSVQLFTDALALADNLSEHPVRHDG